MIPAGTVRYVLWYLGFPFVWVMNVSLGVRRISETMSWSHFQRSEYYLLIFWA